MRLKFIPAHWIDYKLIAVVRLAQPSKGIKDSMRVYNDDFEVIAAYPKPEDEIQQDVWTTEDDYSYLLVYKQAPIEDERKL